MSRAAKRNVQVTQVSKEEVETDGQVPCKGIVNLGNTCFFNSVLQNLVRTGAFRSRVQDANDASSAAAEADAEEGDTEYADEVETGPMTDVLGAFFKEMCATGVKKKGGSGSVRPTGLFNELIRQSPRYKGYQQHDAHELLWTLLDILRMEERKRLKALDESTTASAASDSAAIAAAAPASSSTLPESDTRETADDMGAGGKDAASSSILSESDTRGNFEGMGASEKEVISLSSTPSKRHT